MDYATKNALRCWHAPDVGRSGRRSTRRFGWGCVRAISGIVLLSWVMSGVAGLAVSPGDSMSDVIDELGAPSGRIEMGSRTLLSYDRGDVVIEADRVVEAELISEDQAEQLRQQREIREQERRERERLEREQRRLEGLEIRARKLGDEDFMSAPAAERVAFWRSFQQAYPEVELGEEYSQALAEYEMELRAKSAAAATTTPAPVEQQALPNSDIYYSENHYYSTYGSGFGWYGSRLHPAFTHPYRRPRSYVHERPSYGYGYQDPIEVPERPDRPIHRPPARPQPLPGRVR